MVLPPSLGLARRRHVWGRLLATDDESLHVAVSFARDFKRNNDGSWPLGRQVMIGSCHKQETFKGSVVAVIIRCRGRVSSRSSKGESCPRLELDAARRHGARRQSGGCSAQVQGLRLSYSLNWCERAAMACLTATCSCHSLACLPTRVACPMLQTGQLWCL